MWTKHFFSHRSGLTSFGVSVIVLCVLPFLFDVALCDEFAAAPLLEPTWIDGEKVDPSKATDYSLAPDCQFISRVPQAVANGEGTPVSLDLQSPRRSCLVVVSITSRPPPIS